MHPPATADPPGPRAAEYDVARTFDVARGGYSFAQAERVTGNTMVCAPLRAAPPRAACRAPPRPNRPLVRAGHAGRAGVVAHRRRALARRTGSPTTTRCLRSSRRRGCRLLGAGGLGRFIPRERRRGRCSRREAPLQLRAAPVRSGHRTLRAATQTDPVRVVRRSFLSPLFNGTY